MKKLSPLLLIVLFFASSSLAQTITQQPTSQTVPAGQTATFTVGFTGGVCSSVWYTGAGNFYGPRSASPMSYAIPNVTMSENGIFVEVILFSCTGGNSSVLSNTATLTVTPSVPLSSVAISPLTPTIAVGQTQTFTATGIYSDGTSQKLSTAAWSSDTPSVATVSSSGVVTAVAVGTANISTSAGGFTASTPITVDLASVTLSVNGKAVFDDGTVILPGPLTVSQRQDSTTTFTCGVITSDTSGNLSGSITVNPNFADTNGNVAFIFGIPALPNLITYPAPATEFQQGATGLTLQLVLYRKALVVKSQLIAMTP